MIRLNWSFVSPPRTGPRCVQCPALCWRRLEQLFVRAACLQALERALNVSWLQPLAAAWTAGGNKAEMQLGGAAGAAPQPGASASCPGAADGPAADLAGLAQQVANLTHALADSRHLAPAAAGAAPRGSFLAGALFMLLLLGLLGALAAYRFRYSLRRLSKRHEQRAVLRQLNYMDPGELRRLLGDASLPAWVRR